MFQKEKNLFLFRFQKSINDMQTRREAFFFPFASLIRLTMKMINKRRENSFPNLNSFHVLFALSPTRFHAWTWTWTWMSEGHTWSTTHFHFEEFRYCFDKRKERKASSGIVRDNKKFVSWCKMLIIHDASRVAWQFSVSWRPH